MTLPLLLSFMFSLSIAFFVTSLARPSTKSGASYLPVKFSLAVGMGQGITSCVFFLWLMTFGRLGRRLIAAEAVTVAALLAGSVYSAKRSRGRTPLSTGAPNTSFEEISGKLRHGPLLAVAFCAAFVSTALGILAALLRAPSGWSDAVAIWNLRARGIFRGGAHWRDSFSSLIPPVTPRLPPAAAARQCRAWMDVRRRREAVNKLLDYHRYVAVLRGSKGRMLLVLVRLSL